MTFDLLTQRGHPSRPDLLTAPAAIARHASRNTASSRTAPGGRQGDSPHANLGRRVGQKSRTAVAHPRRPLRPLLCRSYSGHLPTKSQSRLLRTLLYLPERCGPARSRAPAVRRRSERVAPAHPRTGFPAFLNPPSLNVYSDTPRTYCSGLLFGSHTKPPEQCRASGDRAMPCGNGLNSCSTEQQRSCSTKQLRLGRAFVPPF